MWIFREWKPFTKKMWAIWILDWILAIGLIIASIVISILPHPTKRNVIWNNPSIAFTETALHITTNMNYGIGIGVNLVAVLFFSLLHKSLYELSVGIITFCEGYGMAHVISNSWKMLVGELRPDFISRCNPMPDVGTLIQEQLTNPLSGQNFQCAFPEDEFQGRESFPSGHAVTAAVCGFFLTYYLAGKLRLYDGTAQFWKLFMCYIPALWALCIAGLRVGENGHHGWDAVAGLAVGFSAMTIAYSFNYFSIFDKEKCHLPRLKGEEEEPTNHNMELPVQEDGPL